MNPSQLKKVVWLIETSPLDEEDMNTLSTFSGGLCIDPSGLILTSAQVVTLPGLGQIDCLIRAGSFDDWGITDREVQVITVFPQFDLALFKVSKAENEVFDFFPISKSVQLFPGESVHGFIHQCRLPYSLVPGHTNYPFPANVVLPEMTDKTTMKSSGLLERKPTTLVVGEYRTVASVTTKKNVAFHHLHPNIPLVQVSGFGNDAGVAGTPLFKYKTGELIGVFTSSNLVIPVNLLSKFVDHVRSVYNC